jgi:hypothetical protein
VFANVSHFHPSLTFVGQVWGLPEWSALWDSTLIVDLLTNIRLGWKLMEVANALAYYDTATIIVVKTSRPNLQNI